MFSPRQVQFLFSSSVNLLRWVSGSFQQSSVAISRPYPLEVSIDSKAYREGLTTANARAGGFNCGSGIRDPLRINCGTTIRRIKAETACVVFPSVEAIRPRTPPIKETRVRVIQLRGITLIP